VPVVASWETLAHVVVVLAAVVLALVSLAAAAHKPPFKQLGQVIGWVFGRLVGEPVAAWYSKQVTSKVGPLLAEHRVLVAADVERAVAPIREEQVAVAAELRRHMTDEVAAITSHTAQMEAHMVEDREQFAELREWRAGVDIALHNIEAAHTPHIERVPMPEGEAAAGG
jgi:hypothetical protein